jgi:hypothetical protein
VRSYVSTYWKVNKKNIRICETERPDDKTIVTRDLPNVSVFCVAPNTDMHVPFYAEAAVTDTTYLDMLQQWLWSQLQEDFRGRLGSTVLKVAAMLQFPDARATKSNPGFLTVSC